MHRPGIFHPCRQNLLGRDASSRHFSSLQTESSRQGIHRPGIFHPCRQISSSGMHRPRIFHPCRQNLLVRDASPRDFSSLQTESSRQGCIAPGFFILADRIFSSGMHRPGIFHPCRQNLLVRDASSPQLCPKLAGRTRSPPSSPQFTSTLAGRLRSPPSSPQFTSTLAGRTLIKPAVPIFKLPAFIPDDLFPVSHGTFRIQFPHDEFSFA